MAAVQRVAATQLRASGPPANRPSVKGMPFLPGRITRSIATTLPPGRMTRGQTQLGASALESFSGFSNLMKPELAAVFSAVIAVSSVGLNLYGGLLTESKRADLQREVEREKSYREQQQELQSIIARYRGPLLESAIDLEQRIYHLITMTGEWWLSSDQLCYEEITYTLFTIAQFLGFVEVVRREGPRERSFLQAGNPQGADTLATLVESFRFVLCASPASLQSWYDERPGEVLEHPGARHRTVQVPGRSRKASKSASMQATELPLRISRGMQRAIGSLMIVTPMGATRHYTLSYSQFYQKLHTDTQFAQWFQQLEQDLVELLTGPAWSAEAPFPMSRWTRVLLMQQLLVDCIDLLDPDTVRVPSSRRMRLFPVQYTPLPNVEEYKARLSALSVALDPYHAHPMNGLQNLMQPAAPTPLPLAAPLQLPQVGLPGLPGLAPAGGGSGGSGNSVVSVGVQNGGGGNGVASNGNGNGNGTGGKERAKEVVLEEAGKR